MPAHRLSSLCGVATILLAVLLLADAPLSPSIVTGAPLPPSDGEMALVEQLAELTGTDQRFHLFDASTRWPHSVAAPRFRLFGVSGAAARRDGLLITLPYGKLIAEAAEHYSLDGLLLAAVVEAESGFDPRAVSPRGAQGLMQLMPATAADIGLHQPHDPRSNVRAGARYLRDQLRRFDDDLVLALAAYNAGPGNVLRYRGVPPFRETRAYVDRVLSNYLRLHSELWLEGGQSGLDGEPGDSEDAAVRSTGGRILAVAGLGLRSPA